MPPKIIEDYTECGVNIGKIVRRIVKYAPPYSIHGLKEIALLDKDSENIGFASYSKKEKKIKIFVKDIIGWQPWFLKKSYIFPYLTIGLALGHEIDHHFRSGVNGINKEIFAEKNALIYVYPSFGVFKYIVKFIFFIQRNYKRIKK